MKKILFLTTSYPNTQSSASILCSHRVIKCVTESGRYDVHVLCLCYPMELLYEKIDNIHVHRVRPSWWLRCRQIVMQSHKHPGIERLFEMIQKAITIPSFPQTEPYTTNLFYRAAKRLHKSIGFDLVVSEHHGLLTLMAGCRLMSDCKLKHLAIFWDPLKGQMTTKYLPQFFTDKRIMREEINAVKFTSLQISMASMLAYHKKHGDIKDAKRIYLDIPSILKPEQFVPTKYLRCIRKGWINIVFSGLLSPTYRDPRPIINLLNQTFFSKSINLIFFSKGAKDELTQSAMSFKGSIIIHDYIPLSELHTLYGYSDYLLNISHLNPNMVPSKIFEYMSYGKPIISTYPTDGDAALKYVSRYPEGLCIDIRKSDAENVAILNRFLSKEHQGVPFGVVKELFEDNTPEKFLKVIDEII